MQGTVHLRSTRPLAFALLATLAVVAVTVGVGAAPVAGAVTPRFPRSNPVDYTPRVVDDGVVSEAGVRALRQVGRTMFAGGHFDKVLNAARTRAYTRDNLFSFNARTGAVSGWAPAVSGQVDALEVSKDGRYLYAGGAFTVFDDQPVNHLVKYDLRTRRVVTTFRFPVAAKEVTDLQLVRGRLVVAGTFPGGIVALDPTTGARTAYLNRVRASGGEPGWSTRVYRFAVNPGATRMVAVGSFTSVGGRARKQAAMVVLGARATVSRWSSPRWDRDCSVNLRWYTRDVGWDPDGRAFAIVTTGGPAPGTRKLCDTVSWWRNADKPRQQPVWVNRSGGDTFQSVAVTSRAVFTSGHFRWLDNPLGRDSKGPGAVTRTGLAAIDKKTGKATSWNPTKSVEGGLGGFALYFTSQGLWVGHFERYLGRDAAGPELHEGLGLLPF